MKEELAGLAGAMTIIVRMIVEELEKSKVTTKRDFAARLRNVANDAEQRESKLSNRFDLVMLRHSADALDPPSRDWNPVVILGGKENPEND